jgi:hypothetical protein
MRSVVVVLPASMWAMMPMLRVLSMLNWRCAAVVVVKLCSFSRVGFFLRCAPRGRRKTSAGSAAPVVYHL